MRWAVAMRTTCPSASAFKQAFDSGQIVRFHLMRGTWQLVSAANYAWLRMLCSPKAIAVTKGWMSSNKISIEESELKKVRKLLTCIVADKRSATKEDIVQGLAAKGITMDEHRLSYHIRMAEMDGVLCSGDLLPMKATYALTSDKLGEPPAAIDKDEALLRLAQTYFRTRQPATLEDFVWWSGLNIGDCRKAIALMGNTICTEQWQGRTFFFTEDCRTRGYRKGKYLLIPPYDEYLISYKSRDVVLPQEHKHKAHNNSGIFQPIIAHDGLVCGNWTPFKNDYQTTFFLDEHTADLQSEWLKYKDFLQK